MKKFDIQLLMALLFFSMGCQQSDEVEVSYEEYQERILERRMPKLEDIEIKDEHGHLISVDSFELLQRKGDYFDQFYKNKEGVIVSYQMVRKPDFEELAIDCDKVASLLDSVFLIDQKIREKYDPRQDYANLEIVTNVIEQCGMPTSSRSLEAIFMVVQHNHTIHQKKYISSFREAANAGLLSKSTLALMEDRILMNDGKPQLYGTQVRRGVKEEKWALYDLATPEKVDQRRAEMNLGPLSEYLKNFNVEFTVKQTEE